MYWVALRPGRCRQRSRSGNVHAGRPGTERGQVELTPSHASRKDSDPLLVIPFWQDRIVRKPDTGIIQSLSPATRRCLRIDWRL
jgi:hypothetical protein